MSSAYQWWLLLALAGLSFYTYLPARLTPLILLPLIGVALWQHRAQVIAQWRGIALGALVALIVAAPLGLYFIENPVSFTTRIGQVSVLGREDEGIVSNVQKVAGMFAWRGDENPRSNVPGRPALDWLLAPFFAVGLMMALARIWRLAQLWLLAGLVTMLLPTLLSEYAPSVQRAIGALPFVVLLIALGLDGALRLGERLWPCGRPLYLAASALILAVSVALTWQAYFVTWAGAPALFPAWDVGFTQLAQEIGRNDAGVRVYVSPRGGEHPTVEYLLDEYPDIAMPEGFDGRICARVATDVAANYYFLDNEDFRGRALLGGYFPDATQETRIRDAEGAVWATRLTQPANGRVIFPELIVQPITLSDGIDFMGYWMAPENGLPPNERVYVRLFWNVTAPPAHNYTAFAHLVSMDASGATAQLAGSDRPPGEGSCPTTDWLPGEVVVDETPIRAARRTSRCPILSRNRFLYPR